ncbi:MAG: TlpA family protein disulfide reductase [Acidimicrobiia bacterium]
MTDVTPPGVDLAEPGRSRRRSPLWWLLGALVFIGAAVGVAMATDRALSDTDEADTIALRGDAPSFELTEVRRGRPDVRLSDFAGKPVVVNFFGSWCAPCLREMPEFQAVYERYGGEVAFVGIAVNDTRPGARQVLSDTGVTYPAGFDGTGDVVIDYAIRRMPTTVFISPEGDLVERAETTLSEQQLEAIVERLFAV